MLTRLTINGLHNRRTIDIPIVDGRLLLVGENGSGKSTVMGLLFALLTSDWKRLSQFDFVSVGVEIGSDRIELAKGDVDDVVIQVERQFNSLSSDIGWAIERRLQQEDMAELRGDPARMFKIADSFPATSRYNSQVFQYLLARVLPQPDLDDKLLVAYRKMRALFMQIDGALGAHVLFLPTYRRIEQDLQQILHLIEPNLLRDVVNFRDQLAKSTKVGPAIELVEFGMDDVKRTIDRTMVELKEGWRTGLNRLTGVYLREVLQQRYKQVDLEAIRGIDAGQIGAIFRRIGDELLPFDQQVQLEKIVDVVNVGGKLDADQRVAGHFLTLLILFSNQQQELEKKVQSFVAMCNSYLLEKALRFDEVNFEVAAYNGSNRNKASEINLSVLSSGEKQIVSLFAHLYLSGEDQFFVLIDEPELSLSVPWQRKLLPDIFATGRCKGIIAATHSPFIFDNSFLPFTHSLEEFVRQPQ